MTTVPITTIPIMYRDAANWKTNGDIILTGEITHEQKARVAAALDGGLYFLPTQLGIQHLDQNRPLFGGENDHVWHEMQTEDITTERFEPDSLTAALADKSVEDFLTLIETQAKAGWDEATAARQLGITINA